MLNRFIKIVGLLKRGPWSSPGKSTSGGFSLIEVVVAVTFLSTVVLAVSGLAMNTTRANAHNREFLRAHYYAQEGIEVIRNIRDSNWLQNQDWNRGGDYLWEDDFELGGCFVVLANTLPREDGVIVPWRIEAANEFNTLVGDTNFRRQLCIDYPDIPENEITTLYPVYRFANVTSEVTWTNSGNERILELETILTDWKSNE